MEKFIRLTAVACPLDVANLNTDQLIPARFLKLPRSAVLAAALLRDLRFDADCHERPDFPLNPPAYRRPKTVVDALIFSSRSPPQLSTKLPSEYAVPHVPAP